MNNRNQVSILRVENGFQVVVAGKVISSQGMLGGDYYDTKTFVFTNFVDAATFCGKWFEQQEQRGEHLQ